MNEGRQELCAHQIGNYVRDKVAPIFNILRYPPPLLPHVAYEPINFKETSFQDPLTPRGTDKLLMLYLRAYYFLTDLSQLKFEFSRFCERLSFDFRKFPKPRAI